MKIMTMNSRVDLRLRSVMQYIFCLKMLCGGSQDRSRRKLSSGLGRGLVCAFALLALTVSTTATAAAQGAHLQTAADSSESAPTADEPSERRLRAEGFVLALGSTVELELWVASRSLAGLIGESFARDHAIPQANLPMPDLPYRAALLRLDDYQGAELGDSDGTTPQDFDRITRCLLRPLNSQPLYAVRLPCDRPGSGCWQDLGEESTELTSRFFPLQLAIFLENAGYSVRLAGLELAAVLQVLETGKPIEAAPGAARDTAPTPLGPERSLSIDDIQLLPASQLRNRAGECRFVAFPALSAR